jgi:hypothetical protein
MMSSDMAGVEITEETKQPAERAGSADVVVGIAGAVSAEDVRVRAQQMISGAGFRGLFPAVCLYVAGSRSRGGIGGLANRGDTPALTLLPYAPPAQVAGEFWSDVSANQRAVLALADSLNARACIVLGPDLAALHAHAIQLFCLRHP